jgi:hypothetical protein
MGIKFSFTLPKGIHTVFGINPERYNYFGLEEYVFKGVERNPDWICDELKYWNELRARPLDGSSWSPSGCGADTDHYTEGENVYRYVNEIEKRKLELRYTEADLPVPKFEKDGEFGLAYPKKAVEAKKGSEEDDEEDFSDVSEDLDMETIDANSNLYLGNLKEKLIGLNEDDEIAIFIKLKPEMKMKVYIDHTDNGDILVLCSDDPNEGLTGEFVNPETVAAQDFEDTYYLAGNNVKDVIFNEIKDLKTSKETVTHCYDTDNGPKEVGTAVFMILSVKDILNSPSKGERVLLNIFNGGEDEDTYGYYY